VAGATIAVGIAYVLRGPGGGTHGTQAAQGTLGSLWLPMRIGRPMPTPDNQPGHKANGPRGGGAQGSTAQANGPQSAGAQGRGVGDPPERDSGGGAGHG
jgi:hypothetical protein